MWTVVFWKAAGERAAATFAEGFLVAVLGAATVLDLDWRVVLGGPLLMALVSVAKSVVTAALTDGNPSVGSAEELAPPVAEGPEPYQDSPAEYAGFEDPGDGPISAAALLEREGYRPDGDGIGRHGPANGRE
jgi:hypothetical protein